MTSKRNPHELRRFDKVEFKQTSTVTTFTGEKTVYRYILGYAVPMIELFSLDEINRLDQIRKEVADGRRFVLNYMEGQQT